MEAEWKADWIWLKDDPGVAKAVFRKSFELDEEPVEAAIQLTADDAYELYINGRKAAEDNQWKNVDFVDAAPFLKKGKNTLEAVVYNFGAEGGLLLQCEVLMKDGSSAVVKSDSSFCMEVPDFPGKPGLWVIGPPPMRPWGDLKLKPFFRPEALKLKPVELPEEITAGEVFRMKFPSPEKLPASQSGRFRLRFFLNGVETSVSAYPARSGTDRHTGDLTIELPVSPYAAPGNYRWRIEGPSIDIEPEGRAPGLRIKPGVVSRREKAFRWTGKAANNVKTPGGEQAPFVYTTVTPSAENYIKWQATGSHLYEAGINMGSWESRERWDISGLEQQLMQILEADPGASVYLRVRLDTPGWWAAENPDDVHVSNKGRRAHQSFASEAWRKDSVKAVKLLVDMLRERPVGVCIGGLFLMAFKGGEWQLWHEASAEYDCSPAARKVFGEWQEEKGVPEGDRIEIPHPALEYPFRSGEGYARARRIFFEFLADRQADNIIFFTTELKKQLGDDIGLGIYFGYIFEHPASGTKRLLYGSQIGIDRVLREAPVDILSCPASYALRGEGKGQAFMYPWGSAVLNGITPMIEDDIRNYLVSYDEDSSGPVLPDIRSSILSIEKLGLLAAGAGAAVRELALIRSADCFQSPVILSFLRRFNDKVKRLEPLRPGGRGQIALVADPKAYCGIGELPDADRKAKMFLSQIRDTLARTGRPATCIVMDDWREHKKLWDTVVLPLPELLEEEVLGSLAEEFRAVIPPGGLAGTGALVLSRSLEPALLKADSLEDVYEHLATEDARKSGKGTAWYFGGNFTARYDGKAVFLDGES